MSYALECKAELMTIKRSNEENKALLLGMILSGAEIIGERIIFSSTNEDIMNYYAFLMKRVYRLEGEVNEAMIQSKSFLKSYENHLVLSEDIFNELEIENNGVFKHEIRSNQKMASAYLCGAFLARGSVNDPNTSKYHFEITLNETHNAVFVQKLMNDYEFNAKIVKRRNKLVVYVKEAEIIVDILRLMGANKNAFHYEDIRIERDFNNSINRVINCEVANEQKSLSAAREQLRYIKYMEYNYPLEKIDPKILTLMKVRQDNPEASLVELIKILAEDYGEVISKPGLSHRFAKIKSLAVDHYNNKGKK